MLIYLVHILLYSNATDEHEMHLHKVSTRLHEKKLQAKLKKCKFGKPCMKYLGHVVGSGKQLIDINKVAPVQN